MHNVKWIDSGREPECEPDPDYPEGKDIDGSGGLKFCKIDLPYPAQRCGVYIIECDQCGMRAGVTTAGRYDDPRSIKIPCKWRQ